MVGVMSNLVRYSWTSSGEMFCVGEGGGSDCCFDDCICEVWIVSVGINSGDGDGDGGGDGGGDRGGDRGGGGSVGSCLCELLLMR